jgi:hypothetical protein
MKMRRGPIARGISAASWVPAARGIAASSPVRTRSIPATCRSRGGVFTTEGGIVASEPVVSNEVAGTCVLCGAVEGTTCPGFDGTCPFACGSCAGCEPYCCTCYVEAILRA